MRDLMAILFAAIVLAGCTGSGGRTGPGDIPADAFGAMFTDMPAGEVASCLAQAISGTVQANGERFLVTALAGPVTTYDVGTNAAGGDYPTEVIVRGAQDPLQQRRASACFATGVRPA